jgi:hypothetical protein
MHSTTVSESERWGYIHWWFLHIENWSWGNRSFFFDIGEIWELSAIVQALLFSGLLIFEPPEQPGIRRVILLLVFIVLACIFGAIALGFHWTIVYQFFVFVLVLSFALADHWMYGITHLIEYKIALYLVDLPIFLALLVLTIHIGIPMRHGNKEFFSGAIAFQLIVGNATIYLIRLSDKLIFRHNSLLSPNPNNPTQTEGA